MKRILVASDSFKGTLSSMDICALFEETLKDNESYIVHSLPLADGGEGSLDAIAKCKEGRFIDAEVSDLYSNKIKTHFYLDKENNAYIETASCAGYQLKKENNNPCLVTTYGLGEQIKIALKYGCKNIYLFLGGSATNDAGAGLAFALYTEFYNKNGNVFMPTGLTLKDVTRIDNSRTVRLLENVNIIALSDVKSPFFGPEGAAYKFAPQKGATPEEVELLDKGLEHISNIVKRDLDMDLSDLPGSGAAGGLGGGLVAFANARIVSGIDAVLNIIGFNKAIEEADIVVSGEGKFDKQTLDGKVIDGVAKRCEEKGKPLYLIVGISEVDLKTIKARYPSVSMLYETNDKHLPFENVIKTAKEDYIRKIEKLRKDLGKKK